MNAPESDGTFSPKQALVPTPALYGEIVGDGMEHLASVSLSCIDPFGTTEVIVHDVGCGLGAATSAVVVNSKGENVVIKGSDINDDVLDAYRQNIAKNKWPAEAFKMDASALDFPDETFTHSIGSALVFILPNGGIDAMKEMYRTLKPGGVAIVNSWAYTPTLLAIHAACKKTRPAGTPLPRQGLEKWEDAEVLRDVLIKGGFSPDKVSLHQKDVHVTVGHLKRFSTMIWSFIAGTTTAGWLESDEKKWDEAVDAVVEALALTKGFEKLEGGKNKIMFKANVAVATK
jgi:SAM-dependent methyltransferase